jgi:hypothetical protein
MEAAPENLAPLEAELYIYIRTTFRSRYVQLIANFAGWLPEDNFGDVAASPHLISDEVPRRDIRKRNSRFRIDNLVRLPYDWPL